MSILEPYYSATDICSRCQHGPIVARDLYAGWQLNLCAECYQKQLAREELERMFALETL